MYKCITNVCLIRRRHKWYKKPKEEKGSDRESRNRGHEEDCHRLESALERIEERLKSLEKRFKGHVENPRKREKREDFK